MIGLAEWESGFLFSELVAFFSGIRIHPCIVFLLAAVGQIMALPASEIFASKWHIQLGRPSLTQLAVTP